MLDWFTDPVSSTLNAALAYLWSLITTMYQNATQAMLMGTINFLMASPWPNLASPWFKTFWSNGFGLVILVSFMYLAISAIRSMLSSKDSSLGETAIWVLRNFSTGSFTLVVVLAGMAVADLFMLLLSTLFGSVVGSPDWGNALLQARDYTQTDAIAQFLAFNVTTTNSILMYMQASVAGGALMMYLIWYLFAGLLGNGFIGKVIRSLLLAIVFTQVFARVAQVALLGIGAMITHAGIELGFAPIAFAMTAAICTSAAFLVPPVMVVALTIQFYKHERALDPKVIVRNMAAQKTSAFSTQKLNSNRAEAMTSTRTSGGEPSRNLTRAIATAAAVTAIAKVTSLILSKIPTPQTRAAALGVAAIGLGSKAAQNYANYRVGARVGRIGRSQTKKTA
ncbi:MAG: hypothetical protein ACOH18_02570 [Candidatus Saccharimonadaceae bacterium]